MKVALLWWCMSVMALGMAFVTRKAKRSTTKLRLLLSGPSGSGKTWGALTLAKLFTAHQSAESWIWLGDWSFAWYVQRLSDCAHPLVVHLNGSRVIAPLRDTDGKAFWERQVRLTPLGEDMVRDRADFVMDLFRLLQTTLVTLT
jgi:hypothetical protein